MDRWEGKTAVVTGASAGIGAAIAVSLANAGMRVVGLARRPELIEELKSQVQGRGSIQSRKCDVSRLEEVSAAFRWVEESLGPVHVLVNNAGVFVAGNITDLADAQISDDQLLSVLDINVKALMMCTRRAVASMKKHSFEGHIINISSIAGHYIPFSPQFNIYGPSKYAVTAFTSSLLNELAHLNSGIRITNISPGLVDTDMASGMQDVPILKASDIADAALYALSVPPTVNITIKYMDRWEGKTAVVTGASAGIGAAIAVSLANAGMRVVGLARRPQLIEELKAQVQGRGFIHPLQCDLSQLEQVSAAFKWIEESFGPVHVLVNNAGVFVIGNITDLADNQISDEQLLSILDINVKTVIVCTRHAVASMKKHSFDGHIINISSLSGHYIPSWPQSNLNAASKHAATAFGSSLLNELAHLNSGIRVTNISPGLVATNMTTGVQNKPILKASDVADAALYALSVPPTINISEITIQPVGEKRL